MTPHQLTAAMRAAGITDAHLEDLGGRVLLPVGNLPNGLLMCFTHADESRCQMSGPDGPMNDLLHWQADDPAGGEPVEGGQGPVTVAEALDMLSARAGGAW
jgi:hypothetical protein